MNTTKKKIFFALKYIFAISLIVGGILIFIENVKLIEIAKEKPFDVVVANISPNSAEVFWKTSEDRLQLLTYREKGSTEALQFVSENLFVFDDNLTKTNLYIGRIGELKPDTEYEFHIISNRKMWRDGYSFNTPKVKDNITMPTVTTGTATFDKLLLMTSEDGEKIMINSWYVGSYAFDSQGKKYTKQEYAQISTKEILREKLNSMLVRRVYADGSAQTPGERLKLPANCLTGIEINNEAFVVSYAGSYYSWGWLKAIADRHYGRENSDSKANYVEICFNDVYCTSMESGVNPWFALTMWYQETAGSNYVAINANNTHDFGVDPGLDDLYVNFKDQLDWFIKLAKMGTLYANCGGTISEQEFLDMEEVTDKKKRRDIISDDVVRLMGEKIETNAKWGAKYKSGCDGSLFEGLKYWTKTNYHYAIITAQSEMPLSPLYLFGGAEKTTEGVENYINIGSSQDYYSGYSLIPADHNACNYSNASINLDKMLSGGESEYTEEGLEEKTVYIHPQMDPWSEEHLCQHITGCECTVVIGGLKVVGPFKVRRNEYCLDGGPWYKCWGTADWGDDGCEETKNTRTRCHQLDDEGMEWFSSEEVCKGTTKGGGGPGGPGSRFGPPSESDGGNKDCSEDPPGKAGIIIGETCWDGGGCECFRSKDGEEYKGYLKEVPCGKKCKESEDDPEDIIIGDTDVICENENGCICIYPGPPERTERVELGDFCGKDGTIIRGDGKTILYITDEDQHCNNRKGCICYWLEVDPRIQKDVENKYVCLAIPPGDVVPVDRYGKEEIQMGDRYMVCENEKGCICMYSDEANTELVVKQGEACTPLPDPQIIRTILHIPLDNDLHCNDRNNCICQWDEISREPDWAVVTNKDVCKRDGSIEPKNTYGKEKLYITDEDRDCENESGCICIYPEGSGIEDKDVKIGKTCTTDGRVIETPNICCYNDNNETLSKLKPYICKEIPGEIRREIAIDYCSLNTKEYKISEGYNFINPVYVIGEQSSAPTTAHELINMSDNRVTTVALFQNGSWVKIVQLEKDSETGLYKIFGPDFPLISGNTYLVLSKARLDFKFTVKGAAIPIPLKIEDLRSGWHLIPSKTLSSDTNKTAQDILNDQEFNLMHQIAQWSMPKSHFLYTVKDNENNIFGDEIKIGNSEGVFIRIKGNSIN